MVQRLKPGRGRAMTTRGLRIAGTRCRLPGATVAPGLLLSLASSAVFAGPPGIQSNSLEPAASATAERSSQVETADGDHDSVQAVSYAVSGATDAGLERDSAPARGEADVGDGGKGRPESLEDLVVAFLERL